MALRSANEVVCCIAGAELAQVDGVWGGSTEIKERELRNWRWSWSHITLLRGRTLQGTSAIHSAATARQRQRQRQHQYQWSKEQKKKYAPPMPLHDLGP